MNIYFGYSSIWRCFYLITNDLYEFIFGDKGNFTVSSIDDGGYFGFDSSLVNIVDLLVSLVLMIDSNLRSLLLMLIIMEFRLRRVSFSLLALLLLSMLTMY